MFLYVLRVRSCKQYAILLISKKYCKLEHLEQLEPVHKSDESMMGCYFSSITTFHNLSFNENPFAWIFIV